MTTCSGAHTLKYRHIELLRHAVHHMPHMGRWSALLKVTGMLKGRGNGYLLSY